VEGEEGQKGRRKEGREKRGKGREMRPPDEIFGYATGLLKTHFFQFILIALFAYLSWTLCGSI